MKNYTQKIYNEQTFEFEKEIKTNIPENLVSDLNQFFEENFESKKWILTPFFIDKNDLSVISGILQKGTDGKGKRFRLKIEEVQN